MALIQEFEIPRAVVLVDPGLRDRVLDAARREISRAFWHWYAEHQDEVVIERRVLFFSLRLRWRDLRPVFVRIFGEP